MRNGAGYCQLSSISTIRTGLTLRNDLRLQEKGNITVIQPKDIHEGELLNLPSFIDVPAIPISQHLLYEKDLLLANKGQKFGTLLYKNEFDKAVASASFFVIKVDVKKCIPEFIQWYLDLQETKNYLLRNSITATIPSLNKTVLANLQVPTPSLSIQQKIVDLINLIRVEHSLFKQLIEKSEEYRDSYAWELITNS